MINVFDVKDGYWNCPLFYDETDPDSARNNSRRLTAFQSECGEWQFKCLPQGLSCSGPYFQAWLTRIFRKYNIVLGHGHYDNWGHVMHGLGTPRLGIQVIDLEHNNKG